MCELRLGVFASHGGTNLQSVIDACDNGSLNASVCVVISNNAGALVLERARKHGIPCYHLSSIKYPEQGMLDDAILEALEKHSVEVIILAGYMKKLGRRVLQKYKGRILNIHPALLPKYGGKGMYGSYVHEAVINAEEKKTGVTIHLVDENYDTGEILSQCEVEVKEDDSIESLSKRVLDREHSFLVETLQRICEGKIKLR